MTDTLKVVKANRMRFNRQKTAIFKKANDIFVDGLDTGRDRRIYVLVIDKTKSRPRYARYNSHPKKAWVTSPEEVVGFFLLENQSN